MAAGASKAQIDFQWPEQFNMVPRQIFTDPEIYRLEMERIFYGPVWHLVAHEAEIPNPGDYKTIEVGEVPVLIIRGKDGGINTLVNSCAHRGTKVVHDGYGHESGQVIRCIYHMWSYDLQGNLQGVSYPDQFPEDFCKGNHGLPRLKQERFLGCIFITLNENTPPLKEYLGDTVIEGMEAALGDGALQILGVQSLVFHCNWKLYSENAYDSYHATTLHGALRMLRLKSSDDYYVHAPMTCDGMYAHTWTHYRSLPIEDKNKDVLHDYSLLEVKSKKNFTSELLNLFPTPYVVDQLDTLQLRFVIPRGVDKTEVNFVNFARQGETEEVIRHRVRQGSNLFGPDGLVTLEDATALQRLQASVSAGGYNVVLKGVPHNPGPYLGGEEGGIVQFYTAYKKIMGF